jgi:outer membrane protein
MVRFRRGSRARALLSWLGPAAAACFLAPPAVAQSIPVAPDGDAEPATDGGFYLHVAPGALLFDADAKVESGGSVIPGATVSIDPNVTAISEIGYRWKRLGISLTGGLPPLASVKGAGTLSPYGTLGRIRYGPTVLTAHYHFAGLGRFQPYVGGGVVLLLIFKDEDVAVNKLRVDNHWGAAVQFGAEYRLNRRLSLYLDYKKAALKTNATAILGGAPIEANIRLNPTVVSGGLSIRL